MKKSSPIGNDTNVHNRIAFKNHVLKDGVNYQELRPDDLDTLQPRRLTHYLVKRLESLGHVVALTPLDKAAQRVIFRSAAEQWRILASR